MPAVVLAGNDNSCLIRALMARYRRIYPHYNPHQAVRRSRPPPLVNIVKLPQRTRDIKQHFAVQLLPPKPVPSYRLMIVLRNPGARLGAFSNVVPRVTTTSWPSRASNSRINRVGRGVVATTTFGCCPRRSPNCNMSQIDGSRHEPSSSQTAASCCGPRSRSVSAR